MLKSSEEWYMSGVNQIIEPSGWMWDDDKELDEAEVMESWYKPISQDEYERRLGMSVFRACEQNETPRSFFNRKKDQTSRSEKTVAENSDDDLSKDKCVLF